MSNYYDVLGVSKTTTDAEIKKAYRKLAQEHHPDKGGDEVQFKKIKEAFEGIETAEKRAAYANPRPEQWQRSGRAPSMDDLMRAMHAAHEQAQRNAVPFITLNVSIQNAFNGTKIALNLFGRSIGYQLRPGMPQGVAYNDEVPVDDGKRAIQVKLNIISDKFNFKQVGSIDGMNFIGDLEGAIEVDALDILAGAWTNTKDFLDKELQVRIPSGFDPMMRLKVAGHGYSNWNGDKAGPRGDLYLRVIPKFRAVTELDPVKVEALYNATRPKDKP